MENYYAIVCRDIEDSKAIRLDKLTEHLAHVKSVADRIKIAAPLRDNDEQEFTGSLLVVTATSISDARRFIEADPYFVANIWRDITIDKLGTAAGDWVGGIPW